MKKYILGIDLGTGNSCMSVIESGEPTILENAEGKRTTPSIIGFTKSGEILVGEAAKRQAVTNATNTVYAVKRLMGQPYKDIKEFVDKLPYKVVEAANGMCEIIVELGGEEKRYTPEQISAMILQKLKTDAEAKLGTTITDAIITVPAYFNAQQRQATKDAGTIAGLNVLRTIAEPTSASLAYGLAKDENEKIIVFDLGSGTLDVSVLELGDGVFEVLATNGDVELGGTDWDNALMDWLVSEFKSETGIDLSKDSMAVQRLKEEAEKAKIALSSAQTIDVNLPFITADASGPKHLNKTLTRAKFEQLTQHLVDRTVAPFKKSMEDANVSIEDINKVVLVGGQTRSPAIQALVNELTKKEPCKGVNPDECVAAGAAIQGSVLTGENTDILLLDVTPLSLGICVNQNEMNILIEKNTTIPAKKSQVYSTAVDNQPAVTIQVATGERPRFSDNKLLGTFHLEGIAPAPRGIPQIEVTFDIDANGILKVTAVAKGTAKEQSISLPDSGTLSNEDIEKMKKDAELNAEADKKYKELSEAKNRAEGLVYAAEKAVEENKEKVAQELVDEVNKAVEEVKAVKDSEDVEAIKAKTEELNKAMMKIGEEIYKQQQAEAATQQPQENTTTKDTNTKEDPNVVDV